MKNFSWKNLLPHLIAIVAFVIVAAIYCKPALEGKVLSQSDVIQWKAMAQQSFEYKEKHGHFPLWTNSMFGGMPAYQIAMESANPISLGYFHHVFMLFLPKPIGFFFLLCIGFYFLSQVFRINPYLGILGSLAYAYASYSTILIATGHDTKVLAMGYLPALLGAILLVYKRQYLLGAVFTIIFSCLLVAMNHLQITYYFLLIAFIATIFYVVDWIKHKEYGHLWKSLLIVVVAGLVGAAVNMVSLATTYDYSKATMRNGTLNLSDSSKPTTGGLPIDYAFGWSYGVAETFTLLVPDVYGGSSGGGQLGEKSHLAKLVMGKGASDEQAAEFASRFPTYWGPQPNTSGPVYLGAVIVFLFVLGLFYIKSKDKWWIAVACLLGILMCWGKNFNTFNSFLFNYLPYYNKFRAPSMALVIPQLLFPLLAVLALQKFLFEEKNKNYAQAILKKSGYAIAGLLVVTALLYISFNYKGDNDQGIISSINQMVQNNPEESKTFYSALMQDRQSLFGADLVRSLIFIGLSFALLWLFIRNKIKPVHAMAGLLLLSSFDLFAVGRRYLNDSNYQDAETFDESYFTPGPADIQILKDTGNYRVLNLTQDVFNDAITSYHHNSLGGYHPAKLSLTEDLLNHQLRNRQPMNRQVLNMLNAKYIIQPGPQNQPVVALNDEALGNCWLIKHIQFVDGPAAAMKALDNFDPKDTAIVENSFKSSIPFEPQWDSTASISLIKNDNDIITYHFKASTDQFAVFSEIYYDRGWKAYIDNKESPIIKTDYALRGLAIPKGEHEIRFEFKPASYYNSVKISTTASVIGWIAILACIGIYYKKRQQKKTSNV